MKKILIILILAAFSLNIIYAMPPHPRVIQEYSENNLLSLLSRQLVFDEQTGKNQAVSSFPSTGTRRILVLLAGFDDAPLDNISTDVFYDNLFTNGPEGNGLSWKKYYMDMSNNNLILEFDVYNVGNVANTHDYYGENTSGNPGSDAYPGRFVAEAVNSGDVNNSIDYSLYDNDGDGYVDAVIVIHQGQGEEYTGSAGINAYNIWSHRWNLSSANYFNNGSAGYNDIAVDTNNDGILEYDGVLIKDYAIQPEYLSSPGDTTIGVFVHEFGHILGLPDLYDTGYTTDGIGNWGLMSGGAWLGPDGNGSQPAPLSAWSRTQLGWLTVSTTAAQRIYPNSGFYLTNCYLFILILLLVILLILNTFTKRKFQKRILAPVVLFSLLFFATCGKKETVSSVNLADVEVSYKAQRITINEDEYLLVENKIKTADTWTEYLPGQGLLVYHLDDSLITDRYSANTINDYSINGKLGIRVVEADADNNLLDPDDGDTGSATDPFYYGNADTIQNFTANSGETTNFFIKNISGIGSVISFDVLVY